MPRVLPGTTIDGQAPTMHIPTGTASGCFFFEEKGGDRSKSLTLRQGTKIIGKTDCDWGEKLIV